MIPLSINPRNKNIELQDIERRCKISRQGKVNKAAFIVCKSSGGLS